MMPIPEPADEMVLREDSLRGWQRSTLGRRKRIYVCAPAAGELGVDVERLRSICRLIAEQGNLPIAPQLYLPSFLDEQADRELALALRLELVPICDELHVYSHRLTTTMHREVRRAQAFGVQVRFMETLS